MSVYITLLQLDFILEQDISNVTTAVFGHIYPLPPVPFALDQPNGCIDSGLTCPLLAGKNYSYRQTLYVKEIYPSVSILYFNFKI